MHNTLYNVFNLKFDYFVVLAFHNDYTKFKNANANFDFNMKIFDDDPSYSKNHSIKAANIAVLTKLHKQAEEELEILFLSYCCFKEEAKTNKAVMKEFKKVEDSFIEGMSIIEGRHLEIYKYHLDELQKDLLSVS
jgi:hypothetical protein